MVEEIETLDLSKEVLPAKTVDREFDEKFLGDTIKYLLDIRNNSLDYIADPAKLNITEIGENDWSLVIDTEDGMKIFEPTAWAKNQTIGITELPKKYHDTLVEKGHINEAVAHLNMWLSEGKPHRVRTVGDTYRALVSPGYNPFDNFDAFNTIAGTIKAANLMRDDIQKPIKFKKAQFSDHNMYIQIIDEGTEWDLGKGDTYKKMIIFRNSEVGDGAMTVEAGVWRYMCQNLMLHGVISRRIHKGEKLEEGIFAPDTMATQNELWNKILRDSLNAGIASDALFDPIIAGIAESKEVKIEPTIAVEKIKKAVKLSDEEQNAIINAMMGSKDIVQEDTGTLFQVINGMTQAAKKLGVERGIEVTRIASNVQNLIKIVA
jgi:hypothetical protein